VLGNSGAIIKLDQASFTPIDVYVPGDRETNPPAYELGISGSYSVLDIDQHLIVTRGRFLEVFGDEVANNPDSPVQLLKRYALPDSFFCGSADSIVGITLLWSGELALATAHGVVGVLPREPDAMSDDRLVRFSVNGARCNEESVDAGAEGFHVVSNSIAADETGGIYVVSSQRMMRFQFDGTGLELAWEATYGLCEAPGGRPAEARPDVIDQILERADAEGLLVVDVANAVSDRLLNEPVDPEARPLVEALLGRDFLERAIASDDFEAGVRRLCGALLLTPQAQLVIDPSPAGPTPRLTLGQGEDCVKVAGLMSDAGAPMTCDGVKLQ
jgi:hypothetical protein